MSDGRSSFAGNFSLARGEECGRIGSDFEALGFTVR